MSERNPDAFCARCKDTMPVVDRPWRMGEMRELSAAPPWVIGRVGRDWLDHEDGHYLCGNCYFDLTDDDSPGPRRARG